MGAQAPLPSEQNQQPLAAPVQPTWWQQHGTTATWVGICAALLVGLANTGSNWYFRHEDNSTKSTDEHINGLIGAKLNPAVSDITQQLKDLSEKIGRLEGRFEQQDAEQKKVNAQIRRQLTQSEALARLRIEPADTLDKIRKEIQVAESKKEQIPYGKLVDYKEAIHGLPPSAADYWRTVAAIINYESFIEQTRGHAPDPAKVAQPCPMTTNSPNYTNNLMVGGFVVRGCIVDLDTTTNGLFGFTFIDCVVRYHGGRVTVGDVRFRNCTFQLDIPAKAPPFAPERDRILFTLLDSPSLRDVTVPRSGM